MQVELKQRGRASIDFVAALGGALRASRLQVSSEISAAGVRNESLPADFDARMAAFEYAVSVAPTHARYAGLRDWLGLHHGPIAMEAFDEVREALVPALEALRSRGPCTLTLATEDPTPDYMRSVAFHGTGTWDGHDHMGFIHGEFVHRRLVARNFGGDIYAQRRQVLAELQHGPYTRILELGTSSGNLTVALSQQFPDAAITGIDVSRRMLEQAQRVGNELGYAWRLLQRRAEQTGLPAESFDLVAAYSLAHELPQTVTRQMLRESLRVLRPGGEFILGDVVPFSAQDRLTQCWAQLEALHGGEPYWREFCSLDMASVAREEGFAEARYFSRGEQSFPHILLARKAA